MSFVPSTELITSNQGVLSLPACLHFDRLVYGGPRQLAVHLDLALEDACCGENRHDQTVRLLLAKAL